MPESAALGSGCDVIGGLWMSTFATLFLAPVVFSLVRKRRA